MLVQFLSVIYLLYKLKKLYNINYKISLVPIIKIILINGIMILSLMIIRLLIGSFPTTRLYSLLEIIIYSIIGVIIYGLLSFKNNLFNEVFTEQFVNRFTKKFRR